MRLGALIILEFSVVDLLRLDIHTFMVSLKDHETTSCAPEGKSGQVTFLQAETKSPDDLLSGTLIDLLMYCT